QALRPGCVTLAVHLLVDGDVRSPGAALVLPGAEIPQRLRVVVAAHLDVPRQLARHDANFLRQDAGLHDADGTGIVADAEVHTMKPVGAKTSHRVVRATHRIP